RQGFLGPRLRAPARCLRHPPAHTRPDTHRRQRAARARARLHPPGDRERLRQPQAADATRAAPRSHTSRPRPPHRATHPRAHARDPAQQTQRPPGTRTRRLRRPLNHIKPLAVRGGGFLPVSLLPFEPERWDRLEEQYRDGMVVEGIVDELRNIGALVEIFPGIRGLLRKGQITREWVSHPEDYLALDEVILVRITKIDRANERVELLCLDISEEEPIEPPAALYPDGPPWLAEPAPDVQDEEEERPESLERDEDAAPPAAISLDTDATDGEPEAAEPVDVVGSGEPASVVEVEELERAITDG